MTGVTPSTVIDLAYACFDPDSSTVTFGAECTKAADVSFLTQRLYLL